MILPVVLGLTIALAALAPLLTRFLGRDAGWVLASGLAALGVWLAVAVPSDGVSFDAPWVPTLDVALRLRADGLALLFALLVLVIGAVVLAYSARYLPPGRAPGFYGLMTAFAAAMLGLVLADDVVLLFVMWEATTLCSFFLIARSGTAAREPAIRTLLITAGGGLSLLAAVATMVVHTGTTQLSTIIADPIWGADPVFATVVGLLVAVAAFTKSAQFPFHSWLPDAMVAPTPVSAYLHAAAMVKAGIYLLMRFSPALGEVPAWNLALIVTGLVTAVMGALFALHRHDLKGLLAYSTVSQLGLLVAAIGVGTTTALVAAAVHTVGHALFKSALFMLVGVVDRQTGTRDLRELSGLWRTKPGTATALVLAALSMAGVPPLLGFLSKESLLATMLEAPGPAWTGPLAAAVTVLASALTFAYAGRIVLGTLAGPLAPAGVVEARAAFLVPAALPALVGLALGPAALLLDPLVTGAAVASTGVATAQADLALWHGVSPELFLSMAVIGIGTVLVLAREPVDRLLDRPLFPGSGVAATEAWRRSTLATGAWVGDFTDSDTPRRHLAVPLLGLLVLAGVGVAAADLPPFDAALSRPLDWLLVGMLAVGVAGLAAARSRLAAVALLGFVGFGVTLWFFTLGAVDVALTQLLVEILTVVIIVLLLLRLPQRFHRSPRQHTIGAGVLAVGAGVAATVGVLTLTGRPGLSPVGGFFVTQAEAETGGTNVVNTILVDFRALDTLGEYTVLGIAGIAVLVALDARGLLPGRRSPGGDRWDSALRRAHDNAVFGRSLTRLVGPVVVVLSALYLLRGHTAPGGGFIAALIGGAGFALVYLTATHPGSRLRWPYLALIGGGVVIGILVGLLGLAGGSFLTPLHGEVLGISLTTALLFDVGVYLAVVGVVLLALRRLGVSVPRTERDPRPSRNGADPDAPPPEGRDGVADAEPDPADPDPAHADREHRSAPKELR